MKIGFFTSNKEWGGSESYLKSIIHGMREKGHNVVFFGVEGSRLFQEINAEGIECAAWTSSRYTRSDKGGLIEVILRAIPLYVTLLLGNLREMMYLQKLFKINSVDVMHINVSGYEVAAASCRLRGIPCLAMNLITPPDEIYWFRRWMMKMTLRLSNHVSSKSNSCTEKWIELACLNRNKCSYVWNSVDLSRFKYDETKHKNINDVFRLISLGRLHPMKGYIYLLEAMKLLNDENITLDIYGEGHQREELRGLISDLGLKDKVSLFEHIENPEDQLMIADCFVLPSVSHESCPAVLPEAMACGLPLITSDFAPLTEVNIDGTTGIVVPMRDSDALAGAIRCLYEDRNLAENMGQAGYQRARDHFSRERMIEETASIYQELWTKKVT